MAGLAIAVFVIRMLEIFDIEQARRMEEADRVETVLEERDRIARELHDGIIQYLYAVGLNLEAAWDQLEDDPGESRARIEFVMEKLDESIREIRHYIANLRSPKDENRTLQEALALIASEFRAGYGVSVTMETRGDSATAAAAGSAQPFAANYPGIAEQRGAARRIESGSHRGRLGAKDGYYHYRR